MFFDQIIIFRELNNENKKNIIKICFFLSLFSYNVSVICLVRKYSKMPLGLLINVSFLLFSIGKVELVTNLNGIFPVIIVT